MVFRKHSDIVIVFAAASVALGAAINYIPINSQLIMFMVAPILFASFNRPRRVYLAMTGTLILVGFWISGSSGGRYTQSLDVILGLTALTLLATEILFRVGREHSRIRVEQARLAAAIQQADESVLITDTDGRIVYVNPAFEKLTGYTAREAIGKKPSILRSGRHDDAFYAALWNTITRGEVWRGHFTNRRSDGALFEERGTISPVRDSRGAIVNYVAIKRDVTNEMNLERQLRQAQKMEALGTLAGGIAHDFNNILSLVLGHCEIAARFVEPDSPAQTHIGQIAKAGQRAADLVKQILAFSRPREHERKPLDIALIVKECLVLIRNTLPETIELRSEIRRESGYVLADPSQVHQVVMNLCANAYQAMEHTGGTLTVTMDRVVLGSALATSSSLLEPGEYVRLRVADTGHGMDSATMQRIFEPFFTTKGPDRGTGLGLSTIHGIAMSYGGAVSVASEVGRGSTFEVYFPRTSECVVPAGLGATGALTQGTGRVLVVDDEELLAAMACDLLRERGYECRSESDPDAALALIEASPDAFDVLVTDHVMPKRTGVQLARSALLARPDLPVVLMSGFADSVSAEDACRQGIVRFIHKPLTSAKLAEAVRAALDSARPPTQA